MRRGRTERETCDLNGWGVGTVVRGHEEWANGSGVWTTWRITGMGETSVLARAIRSEYTGPLQVNRPDDTRVGSEHSVTFQLREWQQVTTPPTTTEHPEEKS